MNRKFLCAAVLVLCMTFAACSTGRAAIVTTGSINDDSFSSIYVGYSGIGVLNIDGGSVLTRSSGYMGYDSDSTGTATIIGSGSSWANSGFLYVGYSGTGTLNIKDGGQVNIQYGSTIGYNSGSIGMATVIGTGSKWTNNGTLYVGNYGGGKLTVADGGLVTAGTLWASLSDLYGNGTIIAKYGAVLDADMVFDGAHGTTAIIPFGSGGTLNVTTADAVLCAGYRSVGSLRIADGVTALSSTGYLGYNSGSIGIAIITGTGSKWTNSGNLYVGNYGSASLLIEAGGQVSNQDGYIGGSSGSTGTVTVTGIGSKWMTNSSLYVGYSGSGRLIVDDGGAVTTGTLWAATSDLSGNGTITAISGAVLDADMVFDGVHGNREIIPFGSDGTLNVTASSSGSLGVGYKGAGTLRIVDGVTALSQIGYLGYNPGSVGTATISGAGSKWANSDVLYVGKSGDGDLNIEAGGRVSNTVGYLGYNSGANGAARVIGAGSTWSNTGRLYVGFSGSGKLTVADGGLVTTTVLYASLSDLYGNGTITTTQGAVLDADMVFDAAHGPVLAIPFGSGGTLNVTAGTVTATTGEFGAGYKGTGTLRIADGATAASHDGYLGYNSGSTGTATITGTNSKWTANSGLYIGNFGSGSLQLEAGGQTSSGYSFIGYRSGSNGTVRVSGTGAKWTNNSELHVGYSGSGALTIEAGGQVSNSVGSIGSNSGSAGTVTVIGIGSKWINSSDLRIGQLGSGKLTVSDGGFVTAGSLYASLGDLYGNGTITATAGGLLDANLVFDATHGLTQAIPFGTGGVLNFTVPSASGCILGVGYKGTGTLRIAGVAVTSSFGYLGYYPGSTGTATVTGYNSKWINTNSSIGLWVGFNGNGILNVLNRGQISGKGTDYIGYNSGSTGIVTVNGALSTWTSSGTLYVGHSGTGILNLQAGAQFTNNNGIMNDSYLGYISGSSGTVTITGVGSTWTGYYTHLCVGYAGSGTMNIKAGGQVSIIGITMGLSHGSAGTVTVADAGSKLIASSLGIGSSGNGTMNIQAGGQVNIDGGLIGRNSGSSGVVTVTGVGSTWTSNYLDVSPFGSLVVSDGGLVTTGIFRASLSKLYGNGTINVTKGAVLDADIIFDSTHGMTQIYPFGTGGTLNVTQAGGELGAGFNGIGTLRIADGVEITSTSGYLGYNTGSNGTATVTGTGTKWTAGNISVGRDGSGTMYIKAGGQVISASASIGSSSEVTVTGATWTNSGALYVSRGILNIQAGGQVGVGGSLYVGNPGSGVLNIQSGGQITNTSYVFLAYASGSTGAVTVAGDGSIWTNNNILHLGYNGSGSLNIQTGGHVSNTDCYIGYIGNSTGAATVSGPGSTWTNNGLLCVGHDNGVTGQLTVADGGKVTATSVSVYNGSPIRFNISGDGMLVLGNASTAGSITNKGMISFYASPFLATGTYTPISEYSGRAITWSGSGSYKAVGGVWNSTVHTFTVTTPTAVAAGESCQIIAGQRLAITDAATGRRIGVSFDDGITGSPTFSAAPMSGSEINALSLTVGYEGTVLSAWNFTTNYSGSEVMLAFDIGVGAENLALWHYSDGVWTPYSADMLTYDANGIVSFTVTGFSGYAVTQVPEPASMALLAFCAMAMLRRRAKR